jgi:hypothetical protein
MMAKPPAIKRKQFNLDANVLYALEALARDNGDSLDQLADLAFRDLLKKLRRPISLREALQVSARTLPDNDREPKRSRAKA